MPETTRARRLRLLALAFAVGAIIYAFTPKGPSVRGSLKNAASRNSMPEFSLPKVGGGEWSFADNRGKVLLVNFWATWCAPCRRETPELVRLHEKYSGRGFSVVGISLDDEPADVVPGFIQRFRVNYPMLVPNAEFSLANQIQTLPTTFLVDPRGRIAKTYVGAVSGDMLGEDIERLLAETPAGTRTAD